VDGSALGDAGAGGALLAGLSTVSGEAAHPSLDAGLVMELRSIPRSDAERALRAHVTALLARTLRADASALDATVPLQALGLDSMMAIELKNRLQSSLGLTLTATLVFRFPTVEKLTSHLAERLELGARDAQGESAAPAPSEHAPLDGLDTEALSALLAAELEGVTGP
jgi:acyl carrier protein